MIYYFPASVSSHVLLQLYFW